MRMTFEIESIEDAQNAIQMLHTFIAAHSTEAIVPPKRMAVVELDLSVRTNYCLSAEGISWVDELVKFAEWELLKVPNLGRKSVLEIKEVLDSRGLRLGMPK